jgi:tetratricopeptide (TPR) repeat protein
MPTRWRIFIREQRTMRTGWGWFALLGTTVSSTTLLSTTLLGTGCTTAAPAPTAAADDGTTRLAELRQFRKRVLHGEGAKLKKQLTDQLATSPDDYQTRFMLAVADVPSEASWQAFKRLNFDRPKDPWPLLYMGRIYTTWKMLPQAKELLDRAEEAQPGFFPVGLGRAELLLAQGDDAGAKALYAKLATQADVPELHEALGLIALKAADSGAALAELELAAKADAAGLDAQRGLARLRKAKGDLPGTATALTEVVMMQPIDGAARFELAQTEELLGQERAAYQDYGKAAEIRGVTLEIAQHQAALAAKLNDPALVDPSLEQLAKLDAHNPEPLLTLAQRRLVAKDPKGAEARFREALERDPDSAQAQLGLARLQRDGGHRIEAIEAYRALLQRQNAPEAARTELEPLVDGLGLGGARIGGKDVNAIYASFSADLQKFYRERLKAKPQLQGKLRIAVSVDATGRVASVDMVEDTVQDEPLRLHAYFTMKGADFPKAKRSPTFEFDLKP